MPNITITCPYCQAELETPDTLIGKKVVCPSCRQIFQVTAAQSKQDYDSGETGAVIQRSMLSEEEPPPVQHSGTSETVLHGVFERLPIFLSGAALLLAIIALCIGLFSQKLPKYKYTSNPETALREYLSYIGTIAAMVEPGRGYFWAKNGKKILQSLEIKEIKKNGNWAIIFFKLSLGATEEKNTLILYRSAGGDWIPADDLIAKKRCPEKWYQAMMEKKEEFTKGSGSFDMLDWD